MKLAIAAKIVGQHGAALVLPQPEPQALGLLGHAAASPLDRFGKLGGMGRRQHDHGRGAKPALLARGGDGDGRVRIDEHACLFHKTANGHLRLMLTDRMRAEQRAQARKLGLVQAERSRLAQFPHQRPHPCGVAAGKLEQKPLEIAGKLDVHARA